VAKLTGIKCESVGDVIHVRGNLFEYRRVKNTTTLDLNENLSIEEVYYIKEVISFYEELISLNG
tara:strand:- start:303 stop:494 length:192 start_codon:yes stop_codon:yes gene_type:complete